MTDFPDSHRDLLDVKTFPAFATNGPTGFPQVTAVGFVLDEEGLIRISAGTARQKVKNLQRDPRCNLFILDPANPMRYIEIRAEAELVPDPDDAWIRKISAKYGIEDAPRPEERVAITLRPTKVNVLDLSAH